MVHYFLFAHRGDPATHQLTGGLITGPGWFNQLVNFRTKLQNVLAPTQQSKQKYSI